MNQGGFTLVELIVVLAILGVLAGVAALAAGGTLADKQATADPDAALLDSAIVLGRPVSRYIVDSTGAAEWQTYMPDGRTMHGPAFRSTEPDSDAAQ
jgi:prepilin-type N-terminal cleavage/methylation domain-containing protein